MGFRLSILAILGLLISAALVAMPYVYPLPGQEVTDTVAALGRFHIVILHFPICLLLLIPVLELFGAIPMWPHLRDTARFVLFLAVLSAIATCVLGYMLALSHGSTGELIEGHMWASIVTTVLMIVALILRESFLDTDLYGTLAAYVVVLTIAMVSLTVGSHRGASLVHGEGYLTERLPTSIQDRLGTPGMAVESLSNDAAVVHRERVQPSSSNTAVRVTAP